MYLLGYIPRDGRIYLANKDVSVVSYALSLSVVEYQTVVLRGDMDAAAELLDTIPTEQKNKIARFLEGQGYKELALEVATDPEHRFELALALNNLDIGLQLAEDAQEEHKWKRVGDAALSAWDMVLAQQCFEQAKDIGSLFLIHTASGSATGLRALAAQADQQEQHNLAFSALWQVGDVEACVQLLLKTNRHAEAALLTQTYKPSLTKQVTQQWKAKLVEDKRPKIADAIAVPEEDEEMFENWAAYLDAEKNQGEDLIDVGAEEVEEAEEAEAQAEE